MSPLPITATMVYNEEKLIDGLEHNYLLNTTTHLHAQGDRCHVPQITGKSLYIQWEN